MEDLKKVYDRAFKLQDYVLCMKIAQKAQNFKIDLNQLGRAIIESKNPLYALYYVRMLKPKDKKPFENVVIDSENARIAYVYARENPHDCNVEKLEEIVLKNGDAQDSAYFVADVSGCNAEKHKAKILDEGDPYACYLYAKKMQPVGKELKQFEDVVIDSEDAEIGYQFAKDVYLADKGRLGRMVLENGSTEDIICYASMLANDGAVDVKSLKLAGDNLVEVIDLMLLSTSGRCLRLQQELEDYIKVYGTYDDVADFILSVEGADVEGLQQIIEQSDRTDLKLEIAMDSDVDLLSLTKSILNDKKGKINYKVTLPKEDLMEKN